MIRNTIFSIGLLLSSTAHADPAVFNDYCYQTRYPDVRAKWVLTGKLAKDHWAQFGQKEGRIAGCSGNIQEPPLSSFNEKCYLARYPDVQAAWTSTGKTAVNHWLQFGRYEGRIPGCTGLPPATANGMAIKLSPTRFGGAVSSLTWNGKEFINVHDHGRQLQSALQVDGYGECNNPTEAGSSKDGAKQTTTSKLLSQSVSATSIHTRTQMAYWTHNQLTGACKKGIDPRVTATGALSPHVLDRLIDLNWGGDMQVARFRNRFEGPLSAISQDFVFEFLTGYLNSEFKYVFRIQSNGSAVAIPQGEYAALSAADGFPPGSVVARSSGPVLMSDANGEYAMGVYLPPSQISGCSGSFHQYATYYFNLGGQGPNGNGTGKWSLAYSENKSSKCILKNSTAYSRQFDVYVAVGTRQQVATKLAGVQSKFK